VRVVEVSDPLSAVPELAAILLLLAGLLRVTSVRAAINLRYYGHTPASLAETYPQSLPEATADGDPPAEAVKRSNWMVDGWPALKAGNRWYAGWVRKYFYEQTIEANKWAGRARNAYHAGILALLGGLTALVAPPADEGSEWRWTLFAVAALGTLGELAWILSESRVWAAARKLFARADKHSQEPPPSADGGAEAQAAPHPATSGETADKVLAEPPGS
jgi:hypothetical protein